MPGEPRSARARSNADTPEVLVVYTFTADKVVVACQGGGGGGGLWRGPQVDGFAGQSGEEREPQGQLDPNRARPMQPQRVRGAMAFALLCALTTPSWVRRNQPVRIQSAAFVSAAGGRATRRTARAVFPGAAPHWWHIANILIYHTHRVIHNCPDHPFALATNPRLQ